MDRPRFVHVSSMVYTRFYHDTILTASTLECFYGLLEFV